MIRYLSGAHNQALVAVATQHGVGLMIQPGNTYHKVVQDYPAWAADNGMFTKTKKGFSALAFILMLLQPNLLANVSRCLFVAAPDVLIVGQDGSVVGDAAKTLLRFPLWASVIRSLGYPVALVAQDGLENLLDNVPWNDVDVLFLGGSTEWKLSEAAHRCSDEAKRRGKRTHMGRVNSYRRLALANSWGIDTADGTYLKYGPDVNLPNLLSWLERLQNETF